MTDLRLVPEMGANWARPLVRDPQEILKRAVAKMVVLGEQVGVSTDHMILLLERGLTVRELLDYLMTRKRNMA